MQKIERSFDLNGQPVKITLGNFGFRCDTAVMLQKGETTVMVFLTVDPKETELDYFPLGVHYMEKHYAGGIISGSRFIKRETRPSDDAIVKGRVIDRSIRPLFPSGFKNPVSIVINVMSYDEVNDPAILGGNAASLALHLSSVPWAGPIALTKVVIGDNEEIISNPIVEVSEKSMTEAIISNTKDTITQLEIEANQVNNAIMGDIFDTAMRDSQVWIDKFNSLKEEFGKEKLPYNESKVDETIVESVKSSYFDKINEAMFDDDNRNNKLEKLYIEISEDKVDEENDISEAQIINAVKYIEKEITRENLLNSKRLSNRGMEEIRDIKIETPFLPRVHGSAMFSRGISQTLSITTLGSTRLAQMGESFEGESEKFFMHHYHGPNYSFGSAGRYSFYPGNREIGHGTLAEKAIKIVMPSQEEFPYTIRVVSEILSQNGSSSMAATCGACLSLMDAGVPIKAPVAGISIGLITQDESQESYKLLLDVQDVEDYYGDMDFKVAGTRDGITAIQMDTKLKGIKSNILKDALNLAEKGRLYILDQYTDILDKPRNELNKYAPRVETVKINTNKIGDLIGPSGKNIKAILELVGDKADIDIQDDGRVNITAVDKETINKVKEEIEKLTEEAELGKVYKGKIVKILPSGAIVSISPSISGYVHVSEISDSFVKDINKHLSMGEEVTVKVLEIDKENDKVKLTIKGVDKKK